MHDLQDVGAWLATRGTQRDDLAPDDAPRSRRSSATDGQLVSFSTNNYLALATSPRMKARAHAALDRYGVGNCESRLLGGNLELYDRLEARLAAIKRKESALLFATGYLTNLGVLPDAREGVEAWRARSATRRATTWKHAFFTDEFNHLSIREGIRASGAPSFAYRHLDMNDLERKLSASTARMRRSSSPTACSASTATSCRCRT